jgi:hypothetical protein
MTTTDQTVTELRNKLFEGLYTFEQMRQAFGWSVPTLYGLCKQGLPYTKIGARRYFDATKVRAWFEQHHAHERQAPRLPGRQPAKRPRVRL